MTVSFFRHNLKYALERLQVPSGRDDSDCKPSAMLHCGAVRAIAPSALMSLDGDHSSA